MREVEAKLDCVIFVHADMDEGALTAFLIDRVGGIPDERAITLTITHDLADLEVSQNEDSDPERALVFPDGFLNFPLAIEIYAVSGHEEPLRERLVPEALKSLWSAGHAAVASCDYEDDLPECGGFKRRSVPWPGR